MNGWTNPLCCSQHRSGPGDDFLSLIGLFYRASQRPWQLQQWLSLACFHYKPWHLISLREMASERWGTRVAKPFFSALDDTLCLSHWCEKCLCVPAPHPSCFCPFCHLLKTHRFEFLEFLMHLQAPPPHLHVAWTLETVIRLLKKPVNLLWMTTTQNTAGGSWKVGASHKSERYTSARYAIYVRNTDLSQLYQSSTVWNQLKQGQSIKVSRFSSEVSFSVVVALACLKLCRFLWKSEKVLKSRHFTSTSIDSYRQVKWRHLCFPTALCSCGDKPKRP